MTAAQVSTAVSEYREYNFSIAPEANKLAESWRKQLVAECPEQNAVTRESIILWLLGRDSERLDLFNPKELEIAKQAMEYRWKILSQRYLGVGRERAYRNLITRLGSLATLRNKLQASIALNHDNQRGVLDVLQEVIQELLQNDTYIQQQMAYIAKIALDKRLKDTLLFATVEEYCLRPVRNQPLLVYRFVNYLRRSQRGGLTQVPGSDLVRLVSEEVLTDDSDNRINLVDNQAIAEYQEAQQIEEQQALRQPVQQEFAKFLQENLGTEAVEWLKLYLQGKTQDEIAKKLGKPIKEIYRLREKISYHAVRVFALKGKPELVDNWLAISLQENNLGLTQNQWQELYENLTPIGRQILDLRKAGNSIEVIAKELELKTHQVMGEWTKVYLAAQSLRNQE
ncbi:HetZ-related protein 2 [Anabaena sp. CCY 9910]|uniref:HetZ-related protein 2 n=1 Tax=Anabaena sp. CCY 9910 TaxID=3103870 RepID=UPI0039E13478